MALNLFSPVTEIPGVGKTRASQLARMKIFTVKDLIYHFPRGYENHSNVVTLGHHNIEQPRSYVLTVATEVNSVMVKKGMTISKFRAFDESGSCEVVFFNSPYIKDVFHIGGTYRFYGKASFSKSRRLTLTSPKYEPIIDGVVLPNYIPVYSLTEGITSKILTKLIKMAIDSILPSVNDPLPEEIREENNLATLAYSISNIHFPQDKASISTAARRLAFDEMLYFALGISTTHKQIELGEADLFEPCSLAPLTKLLPYELTNAQKNAINDIYKDTVRLSGNTAKPMSRILIGDVGSGKTICAIAAMYIAARSGYQSVIMVPTEILAAQHYADIDKLLGKLGITVRLLTGSTTASNKKRIYHEIETGDANVVVGTHALLSDKISFSRLGLIVTDEQHRFGVAQRAILKEKQKKAHMLVMSATPIPRTLALAVYGDLDISKIDEMPKGRMRVDTYTVDESYRTRLNNFIRNQIKTGGQCYIVCPSIEQEITEADEYIRSDELIGNTGEKLDTELKNVIEYTEALKNEFSDLTVASLHGRMRSQEKEAVINEFAKGNVQILVSTTVIEVGVNVQNASLMIVENADRYGMSQLHQLRGRVGRGTRKSYCVLVSSSKSEKARKRLEVMRTTYDGFEIAEQDLILRGPGEFFSSNGDVNLRQSGGFEFKMASVCNDTDLFNTAFTAAKKITDSDPFLIMDEHALLKKELSSFIYNSSTIS